MKKKKMMTSMVVIAIGVALLYQPVKAYALHRPPTGKEVGEAFIDVAKDSYKKLLENLDWLSSKCSTTLYDGATAGDTTTMNCAQLTLQCQAMLISYLAGKSKTHCGEIVKIPDLIEQ